MKCWNSAFAAQGSRVVIVVVLVGAVKIYVAAMEALRKKERDRVKLSFPQKMMVFLVSSPLWMLMFVFCRVKKKISSCI
jgi:hypothetical protein